MEIILINSLNAEESPAVFQQINNSASSEAEDFECISTEATADDDNTDVVVSLCV